MYILDTSAIRGISRTNLETAKTTKRLTISPYSLYELLCHLDEGDFDRCKGNVLKCKIPEMLHDPFAYHAISVGAENLTNPTRFEEPIVTQQLLDALEVSNSLEEFYKSIITLSNGDKGATQDVCEKVRRELQIEEKDYVQHLHVVKDELLNIVPVKEIETITLSKFADIVFASLNNLYESYIRDGIPNSGLKQNIVRSMYIHIGYKLARVITELLHTRNSGSAFSPDTNDTEDSYICSYLDITKDDFLVTHDEGTLSAVGKAIEAFNSKFTPYEIEASAKVININNFNEEIEQ